MKVDEITTTMQTTGNKRVMVRYSDETGVKRQRIGIQPPDLVIYSTLILRESVIFKHIV